MKFVKQLLLALITFFYLSVFEGKAQTTEQGQSFPAGIYMTFEAVDQRKPDFVCVLDFVIRSEYEQNSRPGHLYRVERIDNCITNRQLSKMIAYSSGEQIYFQGKFIDQELGFFSSKHTGKYLPFYYPKGMTAQQNAMIFGLGLALGGGIIPFVIAKSVVLSLNEPGNAATDLPVYFFDLENRQTYPLNNKTFMSLLGLYPDLLQEYEHMDKDEITLEHYFDFLQRMN